MAETFRLKIISPDGIFFNEEIERIVIHGTEGDLAILADHTPLTTTVGVGTFLIIDGKDKRNGTLLGGLATIKPTEVMILTDAAEWPDEIDLERAKEAEKRALKHLQDDRYDSVRAQAALDRAMARLQAKE